nr:protein reduced wall acetylation 2 isoform X2 [Tanacetum cinerariifolium]
MWLRVPDGQPKLLPSLIPDYPMLNFMLTTSIYIVVLYRFFELTNTFKIAFVPSKDDKRLMYNVITAIVISTVVYTLSFIFLKLPQVMKNIENVLRTIFLGTQRNTRDNNLPSGSTVTIKEILELTQEAKKKADEAKSRADAAFK